MMTIARALLWLGGGLFAASLALAVYMFGYAWPRATPLAPDQLATAFASNTLLFSIFAIHHSLLARDAVKRVLVTILPERALRPFYVWTASLFFIIALLLWRPIGHVVYQAPGWMAPAGHVLQGMGLILIAASARLIDALELAGIRPAAHTHLVIRGPYRLVRHPLYLGWLLAVWGAPLMTGDRLLFAALSSAYLVLAMPWEEEAMGRTFGAAYAGYRSTVRWRLIPYLY